jgi:ferrochelatase
MPGMRHWHPYIGAVVEQIVTQGHRRLVGVVLAPHYSAMSVGAYEKRLLEAAAGRLELALVRSWGDHPRFLEAVAGRVTRALHEFPTPAAVHVLFTAHSLPQRILASGDPYPDQLRASAQAVAQRVGLRTWHCAYQSAGATAEPWLGPEAGALMTELAGQGQQAFLIVPIGFVCDHVEVLYDVDVGYRALAERLGVRLERTPSLNDDPLLVAALAEIAHDTAAARGWL